MNPLVPGDAFGRYQLESELGRGGMGVVFLARDDQVGRRVALKVLGPELTDNAEFRARFMREMRIAARLEHPNVIPVYETGQVDDRLFIAMRYVDGPDLSRLVEASGPLSPERAIRVTGMIGAALDAAHAQGLVHRDVKPANVLLTGVEESEHAYLTDFGLSREAESDSGLTNTGQWMGTADYVSPEQLDGKPISARSDIYSMSCLVYNVLTGRLPYEGSLVAKLKGHAFEPVPALPATVPNRVAVEQVLARGCAKDPDDRFPSAGDLALSLAAALRGQSAPTVERTVATGVALSGIATRAGVPAGRRAEHADTQHAARAEPAGQTVFEADRQRSPAPPSAGSPSPRGGRWLALVAAGLCVLVAGGGVAVALSGSRGSDEPATDAALAPPPTTASAPEATTTATTTEQVTTTVEVPQTGTPPQGPPSGGRLFRAPSGNVACEVDADGARCSVASIGKTFVLPPDGGAAYTASELTVPRGSGPLADYGSTVTLGTVTCTVPRASERRGIVCEDGATGHGFEASRHAARQRVY